MDEHDLKALDREFAEESLLKYEPETWYRCGTCGEIHERGDGCEWQEHPTIQPKEKT